MDGLDEFWKHQRVFVTGATGMVGSWLVEPDIRAVAEGEIRAQHLSAAKAGRVLEWRAAFDLETGLGETIDRYRAFLRPESRS